MYSWERKGGDILKIRKDMIFAVLTTFCMCALMFAVIPIRSSLPYDPWADLRGPYEDPNIADGKIDMRDIGYLASMFMTTGTPINKTELLLQLLDRLDQLNTTVIEQQNMINNLNNTVMTLMTSKGYISISSTAFSPHAQHAGFEIQDYEKDLAQLAGRGYYWAYVQLPHGVTLTNITAFLYDAHPVGKISISLEGWNLTSSQPLAVPMAFVETSIPESEGNYKLFDDTIVDARIDNRNCIYSFMATFDGNPTFPWPPWYSVQGILVEYEYQP
jgi:hypothetical protein